MPSKGLDIYACSATGVTAASFDVKQPGASSSQNYPFQSNGILGSDHIEIESDFPHYVGDFDVKVGSELKRSCEINSLTGNVSDSDMGDMLSNQQLQTLPDGMVSYGFYDAGSGYGGVGYTSHHQCYTYTGDNKRSTWMTQLVSENHSLGNKSFSTFVLPGGHDVGMNTSTNIADMAERVQGSTVLLSGLAGWIVSIVLLPIAGLLQIILSAISLLGIIQVKRLLINLAVTQKDSFADMLNMGIRYFDFRPGYNAKIAGIAVASGSGLYHQHNLIPGADFNDFLTDVVAWLNSSANAGEIVVVNLNFSGFYDDAMKPSAGVLQAAIQSALSGTSLVMGSIADTKSSYNSLIQQNKRILFFNQGVGFNHASKADSYSDDAYGQLKPDQLMSKLQEMTPTPGDGQDYTVLQLQGTATAVGALWPKLIGSSSHCGSPLLMTKAYFDNQTYPWAQSNLGQFDAQYPLVILNDFVDPTMSVIAQNATLQRAEQTHYTLILPQGSISVNSQGVFSGSTTQGQWAPYAPDTVGGLNGGDTVTVVATFNLNPDINPQPPGEDYLGLSVGACSLSNTSGIQAMQTQASQIQPGSASASGILLGSNISQNATPTAADVFYGCVPISISTVALQPTSRGTLGPCIYGWCMSYNATNTVVTDGSDVEIVYGYGVYQSGMIVD